MDLRPDGTIVLPFPKRRQKEDGTWEQAGEDEQITLRRPLLEELFDLWDMLDNLTEILPDPPAPEVTPSEDGTVSEKVMVRNNAMTMRRNVYWHQQAIFRLSATQIYIAEDADEQGNRKLRIREDLGEPSYLASGQVAGRWLTHWQTVPLGPGSE